MPGLIIHIAIANKYYKKHKSEIKSYTDFINGIVAPDLYGNRKISHYNKNGCNEDICFEAFLNDDKFDNEDYRNGYLLHLIADHYFYLDDFKKEYEISKRNNFKFYDEYYFLNEKLIKKYNITYIPSEVKKFSEIRKGKNKYLKYSKIKKYINKMAKKSISEQLEKILNQKIDVS